MHTYVINLDRSPERLARIGARLDQLGLPWTRIAAVDGRALGPPPWRGFDAAGYARARGKAFNPAKLGCYLSHYRALEAFDADDKYETALILEDDAVLPDDFPQLIADLLRVQEKWDVVLLDARHGALPARMMPLFGNRQLVTYRAKQTGSAGYLTGRLAAQRYLSRLLPMTVPYDHEYTKAWRYGLRIRGVAPRVIRTSSSHSTIGYEQHTRLKFPWWRRGSVVAYELRTEGARAFHYLFRDVDWMGRSHSR